MAALLRLRDEIVTRIHAEPTAFQAGRLNALLEDIDGIIARGFPAVADGIKGGSNALAVSEAKFTVTMYGKVATTSFALPSEQSLLGAVANSKMTVIPGGAGISIDDALAQFGHSTGDEIAQLIRDRVVLGDTSDQIAREVSRMMRIERSRKIDTLVRTITNHTAAEARAETDRENAQLLDGYQWVSTLDSSTTLICAGRDGEIYQDGIGPRPPAHWGCRSTTIPVVKKEFSLTGGKLFGERSSHGDDGPKPVGANATYGGWLKRQPADFVDEALGPERSKLFRTGEISIDQFTDNTGRTLTLIELEALRPIEIQ